MKRTSFTVAVILTLAANALGQVTLYPLADAHVRDGSFSNTNYGATSPMEVQLSTTSGSTRETFLKFDITGWQTNTMRTATLRINANLVSSGSATLWAAAVSDTSWTSSGITWSNRPTMGANIVSKNIGTTSGTWFSMDVTDYIRSELAAGKTTATIGLRKTATGTPLINIRSAESANDPELVIIANVAPQGYISAYSSYSGGFFPFTSIGPGSVVFYDFEGLAGFGGALTRIDFYTNYSLSSSFTTNTTNFVAIFGPIWTNPPLGIHRIDAVATDELGLAGASSLTNWVLIDLPGLTKAWFFNEGSGTTTRSWDNLLNYGDNGDNNATLSASTNWTSGYSSNGIVMRPHTNFIVSIANTNVLVTNSVIPRTGGSFTIELWLKPYPIPQGWSGLMFSEASTNRGWDLAFHKDAGGQVSINFWSSDNSGTLELSAPVTLTTNVWHKLDVTFDGATAKLYLDGRNVGTGYGGIQMSTNTIYLGGLPGMTNFSGVIDDLKIYNRALAPHEIGPQANVQLVTVFKDGSTNVVMNGQVPPGKPITYSIVANPTNGTLSNVNGSNVTYTPNSTFKGQDTFQYTVSDGTFTSPAATVIFSVVTPRWLSTNGTGNGSSPSSPLLAFPASALDEIIRTNNFYDCFFYAPGTYEMSVMSYGTRSTVFWGCKHIGNGTNTILRGINAWKPTDEEAMFAPHDCTGRVDDFEISNLVLDCNGNNQPKILYGKPVAITVSFPTAAVSSVVLNWNYDWIIGAPFRGGHAKEYGVYVRIPGTGNYALVSTNSVGTGGVNGTETITFAATNTDQVRVVLSRRGVHGTTNLDFYSLGEMTVYAGAQNVSLGQSVSTDEPSFEPHGFLPSYLVDGTTNRWVGGYRGSVIAVHMRAGNNLKFSNLKIVGFATTAFRECFPFGITSSLCNVTTNSYWGNYFVENCIASDPATNNRFNATVFSVAGEPPYYFSNAVVRNCKVMDLRSQFLGIQAYSSTHIENSYATNCDTAVYFEPAPEGFGAGDYPRLYFRSNLFENVGTGVSIAFWASPTNGPQITMGDVILEQNEIILSTNTGWFGFIVHDAGGYPQHGVTSNVVLNANIIRFPNWTNVPALTNLTGGICEWNFLNHVAANNVIHLNTGLDIVLKYSDVLSNGSRRALLNNTNLSGTLLQVKAWSTNLGTIVPAVSQQWSQ